MIIPVSEFRTGESGKITSIETYELKVAMMRMGLVPGEIFEMAEIAPLGDPISVRIGETKIAIRKKEAGKIFAEKL